MKEKIVGILVMTLLIAAGVMPVVGSINEKRIETGECITNKNLFETLIVDDTVTISGNIAISYRNPNGVQQTGGDIFICGTNGLVNVDFNGWIGPYAEYLDDWPPHWTFLSIPAPITIQVKLFDDLCSLSELDNQFVLYQHMKDYYNNELVGESIEHFYLTEIDDNTYYATVTVDIWNEYTGSHPSGDKTIYVEMYQAAPGSVKAQYEYAPGNRDDYRTEVTRFYNYSSSEEIPCPQTLVQEFHEISVEEYHFSYSAQAWYEPALQVTRFDGGIGVTTTIENPCPQDVTLDYDLFVDGGYVFGNTQGRIQIPAGETITLGNNLIIGLGELAIKMSLSEPHPEPAYEFPWRTSGDVFIILVNCDPNPQPA